MPILNPKSKKFLEQKERAKQLARKRATGEVPKASKRDLLAMELGQLYEKRLARYYHAHDLKYFKNGFTDRVMPVLRRAADSAIESGVKAETFIEGQFYWFHEWFGRPPKIYELAGTKSAKNSVWRAHQYVRLRGRGELKREITESANLSPGKKLDNKKLDKLNRARLEELKTVWHKTEEEVILEFWDSGIFDPAWLKSNEIYLSLKNLGKIK